MSKKKKRFNWFILYIAVLVLFTAYVLADTFLIARPLAAAAADETDESADITDAAAAITDDSYSDGSITVSIETLRLYDTDIYVARVTLADINCLQTAFANNTYGRNIKQTTSSMAESNNAILAVNGDYYGFRTAGYVIRGGVIYRDTSNGAEGLAIMADGSFYLYDEADISASQLLAMGALQAFSFGPALVEDGEIAVSADEEVGQAKVSNPRTAIGIISPLEYVFVVSDGRTDASTGLSLYELAGVLKELGCTAAYNLDGGGSSTMWFCGSVVNNPTDGRSAGERKVSDIVYIGY